MIVARLLSAAAAAACLLAITGCGFVPKGQALALETQNRSLREQNEAQLAEIENLKAHYRDVEDRLIEAERSMADSKVGMAKRRSKNGAWGRVESADGYEEELAARLPWLELDPETSMSKFETDVMFESGGAALSPDAEKMLDQLANLLHEPSAKRVRLMIVGHADDQAIAGRDVRERYPDNWHLSSARALAVADYLMSRGVPQEQLGVTSYGSHQPATPNADTDGRQRNRRVEIFVMGPNAPVVGWSRPAPNYH